MQTSCVEASLVTLLLPVTHVAAYDADMCKEATLPDPVSLPPKAMRGGATTLQQTVLSGVHAAQPR